MIRVLLLVVALLVSAGAQAHKASDAYLQLTAGEQGLALRWDIALRDLDAAIGLDADEDGRLTWGEVRSAWPRIEAYALPRLRIDGCPLRLASHGLERRGDGAYATLQLESSCVLKAMPVLHYALLRDVDPTHRGIAKLQFTGERAPVLRLLEPAAMPAASAQPVATGGLEFLRDGIRHIVTGYDHVLFLLCLLLPAVLRREDGPARQSHWKPVERVSQALLPVLGIVSAFTVAHSVTLGLAAAKWVVLPASLIEPAIAATIVLAALDNVRPIFPVRRVVVTFAFGLIHGFGLAGVLAELNLPRTEFALALLEFNVGLELGQLAIVIVAIGLLFALRQRPRYRAWVVRGGSMAAMAVGALWLLERTVNVSLLPV
ncbi:MAG TPA: HupE/UreJ family protein [Burkholderiaceae bacterium]